MFLRARIKWEYNLIKYIIKNYLNIVDFPVLKVKILRRFIILSYFPNLFNAVLILNKNPYDNYVNDILINDTLKKKEEYKYINTRLNIAITNGTA